MIAASSLSSRSDRSDLRRALGQYPTGVAVVTTRAPSGALVGLTVNSFSSLSLDPPIVLWSLRLGSPSHAAFTQSGRFVVNVLCEEQVNLAQRFASPAGDRFDGIALSQGACDGAFPIIAGCAAWFACQIVHAAPGGDHTIFAGRVLAFDRASNAALGFYQGAYFTLSSCEAAHSLRRS